MIINIVVLKIVVLVNEFSRNTHDIIHRKDPVECIIQIIHSRCLQTLEYFREYQLRINETLSIKPMQFDLYRRKEGRKEDNCREGEGQQRQGEISPAVAFSENVRGPGMVFGRR